MYLVVGLGNPGKEYENTRHNVGFEVIDYLSNKLGFDTSRERFGGNFGEYIYAGEKIIFLKPLTYMNLSGESLIEAASFYKIEAENIIVVYDDMAIETGKIRLRPSGSDGGHNGMKNIIAHLQSKEFKRIRVGIGKAPRSIVDYVLGKFTNEERKLIDKSVEAAGEGVMSIIQDGIQNAMNKYNTFNACQDSE
ncbi:aminoacyl-tRNA hydrolase [Clostridium cylindrosporum]|uniref:Peptidyl-tRNA hydrolase n=1 Tax=Clostridium cylindrosporum DSM 605 TaxID=1121307 RepID=A0A0J8D869_CLOCY|nr:aminoacyl-tRNA hydrolase [Clostridium cylindrosporum]KMT22057.1 peptidyl-tRNA hydrolase Pth [Clostridium cylindrosporum DSM 605]